MLWGCSRQIKVDETKTLAATKASGNTGEELNIGKSENFYLPYCLWLDKKEKSY